MAAYKAMAGTQDILPDQQPYWRMVEQTVERVMQLYGFGRIDTPTFEETAVFQRGVGAGTDIVEKEMYSFEDRGGEHLTLRPEGTAGVVRAYLEHGLFMKPQPVKLFYVRVPMFRFERQQRGRYREHHQFGCEALGETDPAVDAEIIAVLMNIYRELGLRGLELHLNSIGDRVCRPRYVQALVEYYRPLYNDLCQDCKVRFDKNPLRLLDCKEPQDQPKVANAPKITDYLDEACAAHFAEVRRLLDAEGISYVLDPLLVRGLDYYSRTAFEVMPVAGASRRQSAIGGGGRYDGLAELLGGRSTPGIGFGAGMERIIEVMKEQGIQPPAEPPLLAYVAYVGAEAKMEAARLVTELRQANIRAELAFGDRSLKAQMKQANASGARYVFVIGEEELQRGEVAVRADSAEGRKHFSVKRGEALAVAQGGKYQKLDRTGQDGE
ncbi:MAG TPA: histidine--tRNA ligase [Ktedonobacterales bacterium]|nr:histidine--tRNA ligase [Ktedonobacterales bacterium]